MASWDTPSVAPPGGMSYAAGLTDFSPIGNLANDFYKGADNKQQYDLKRAFKDGLPTLPGTTIPDIGAMAQTLARLGGVDNAVQLANAAAGQQANLGASDFLAGGSGAPAAGGVPASAPAPAPGGGGAEPRGIRNNNPGNIENGSFAARQPGYTGAESKGRFATFETPQAGITAAQNLLDVYGRQGINTVQGVINRWAPPSDKNDTTSYANTVAAKLGLAPDAQIDLADPGMRAKLSRAMFVVENGRDVVGGGAPAKPSIPPTGVPKGSPDGVPPAQPDAPVRVAGPPTAAPGASPQPVAAQPAGAPVPPPAAASAPAPQSAPASGPSVDPTLGGIVPQQWIAKGGTPQTYLDALLSRAAQPNIAPNAKEALMSRAKAVQDTMSKWNEPTPAMREAKASGFATPLEFENAKVAAKVTAENSAHTPEQKLYEQAVRQGFAGTEMQFQAERERLKGSHFKVIGKDQNGLEIYGFVNPADNSVVPVKADGGQPPAPNLTGEHFLQTLDTGRANQVKAIAEGRMSPPGGMSLKSPQVQALMRDVAQYEPGFDLTTWTARNKTRADLASGKMGQNVTAFNTAIGHLETLDRAAEALNNYNITPLNTVANFVKSKTGDPAIKNFEVARTAVADELTRAFRGSGGNVHDLVQWESAINSAGSPAQLKAAVKQAVELLRSRIEAVGDQYNRGMGKTTDPLELLSPKARHGIQRLSGESPHEDPRTAAPAKAAGKPITRAEFDALPSGASFPAPDGTIRVKP